MKKYMKPTADIVKVTVETHLLDASAAISGEQSNEVALDREDELFWDEF